VIERRGKQQHQPFIASHQIAIHGRHGAPRALGVGGARHHGPRLRDRIDPEALARRAPALRRQPIATSFYSGRGDRFFAENVSFNATLTRLGIPHRFRAVAGGHDASVWRAQMTTELSWIGQEFQRARA